MGEKGEATDTLTLTLRHMCTHSRARPQTGEKMQAAKEKVGEMGEATKQKAAEIAQGAREAVGMDEKTPPPQPRR